MVVLFEAYLIGLYKTIRHNEDVKLTLMKVHFVQTYHIQHFPVLPEKHVILVQTEKPLRALMKYLHSDYVSEILFQIIFKKQMTFEYDLVEGTFVRQVNPKNVCVDELKIHLGNYTQQTDYANHDLFQLFKNENLELTLSENGPVKNNEQTS